MPELGTVVVIEKARYDYACGCTLASILIHFIPYVTGSVGVATSAPVLIVILCAFIIYLSTSICRANCYATIMILDRL